MELALAANGAKLAQNGAFVWPIQTLLRAARDKRITVVTSMLSIAECLHADGQIDERTQRLFRGLLTSGTSGVTPWQIDIFVLERARDLRWQHGINLKPADSIHVATALEASCEEFITWDGLNSTRPKTLLKAAPAIAALGLKVLLPTDTQSIPSEYRQQRFSGAGFGAATDEESPRAS